MVKLNWTKLKCSRSVGTIVTPAHNKLQIHLILQSHSSQLIVLDTIAIIDSKNKRLSSWLSIKITWFYRFRLSYSYLSYLYAHQSFHCTCKSLAIKKTPAGLAHIGPSNCLCISPFEMRLNENPHKNIYRQTFTKATTINC